MRWLVKKARHPADPERPWMAIPGGSTVRARRFASYDEAFAYVQDRIERRKKKTTKP